MMEEGPDGVTRLDHEKRSDSPEEERRVIDDDKNDDSPTDVRDLSLTVRNEDKTMFERGLEDVIPTKSPWVTLWERSA